MQLKPKGFLQAYKVMTKAGCATQQVRDQGVHWVAKQAASYVRHFVLALPSASAHSLSSSESRLTRPLLSGVYASPTVNGTLPTPVLPTPPPNALRTDYASCLHPTSAPWGQGPLLVFH